MTIAGLGARTTGVGSNPGGGESNTAPEWIGTPNPQEDEDYASTYDLTQFVYDPDSGDTLTYSLNAGSTALPTGVTLNGTGTLSFAGTQAVGTTAGVIVDVDDGTVTTASPSFSIVISAAGAAPVQDVKFVHSENSLAPTTQSPGVTGLFTVSKVTNSHENDDPPKARWSTLAASGNNPLYTGENYFDVYLEQIDSEVYRVERACISGEMQDLMTSAGSNEYYQGEKYWFGVVFRIDQLTNFGVNATEGGAYVLQFHMRNWDPPVDYNPPICITHQVGGIYLRIEGSREPDGTSNGDVLVGPIWDETVAGTAGGSYQDGQILGLVLEVLWDSRTNANGGTGYVQVYKDGASTPFTAGSWGSPASPKSNCWPQPHLDVSSPPRSLYLKYGCYRTAYRWYTNDLLNGDISQYSFGNICMHGSGANIQGVWESLNWDNRVGA